MILRAFSGSRGRGLCVILVLSAAVSSGCSPPPPPIATTKGRSGSQERCGEMIDGAFDMLKPERLAIDSRIDTPIGVLNDWTSTCGQSSGDAALKPEQQELLAKHLSEEYLERVTDKRFTQRDGSHIRDCLLWKDTNTFAIHRAEDDLGRIVELFNYVIRNIALVAQGDDRIPLTPFEIAVFGRGTAADRAWLFADILRQLRIDAVILRPRGEAPSEGPAGDEGAWLVGALLDNDVYLFEPRLGTPVPSLNGNDMGAAVQRPATLAEASENDAVLRQLDRSAEKPYPLRAADFRKLRVEVIGNTSFWSPRMRLLQQSLSGERSLIIYDSLEDTDAGPGLITRVSDFGGERWGREHVAVWQYPEENLQGFEDRDQKDKERLFVMQVPFGWPVEFFQDEQTKQVFFGRPKKDQLKIRLNQITGDFGHTITYYNTQTTSIESLMGLQLQVPPNLVIPPEVRRMHARAAEDALYWSGVCQFETGEYQAASDQFLRYLGQYREGGAWSPHARFLRAWSIAEVGDYDIAAQLLEQAPSTDLQADGYGVFIRRWKALAAANTAPADGADTGAPEEPGKAGEGAAAAKNDASQEPAAAGESPSPPNAPDSEKPPEAQAPDSPSAAEAPSG